MTKGISKSELKRFYIKEKLTTYQIAEKLECSSSTIKKRLKKFNIKPRKSYELYANIPSKKRLIDIYVKNKLSTWEIQRRYGYARSTVHRNLRKHNLIKTRAESHRIYPRKSFSGNPIEKAYLIGFRIGDLRVRKFYDNSETIKVDCGSTKTEQINLIKRLFGKYGRVWYSKPDKKGRVQIEAFLDLSFSFLLEKSAPQWIWNNKKYFFSFLAGFTDAEGCIKINKNRAYYRLGNYNSILLNQIYDILVKKGIYCQNPKGYDITKYIGKDGYGHNGTYWQFQVKC